jgi:HEAT repeat protein
MTGQAGGSRLTPREQRRTEVLAQLEALGQSAVPALIRALRDPEVQMRQNAALAMGFLASNYSTAPRVTLDIRSAIPALIDAMDDADSRVRGWAIGALWEIGPDAKAAIPALVRSLNDLNYGSARTVVRHSAGSVLLRKKPFPRYEPHSTTRAISSGGHAAARRVRTCTWSSSAKT